MGVLGMVFSLGITVYGLAYAITYNEGISNVWGPRHDYKISQLSKRIKTVLKFLHFSAPNRKSHYLLAVWGFMTFKWAFYMFQLSRHYNRILSIEVF